MSGIDAGRLVAQPLDVLDVRTGVHHRIAFRAAFAAQLQHARTEAAQEHAVVRYENHRSFEAF